jgi:hypothetical protein
MLRCLPQESSAAVLYIDSVVGGIKAHEVSSSPHASPS